MLWSLRPNTVKYSLLFATNVLYCAIAKGIYIFSHKCLTVPYNPWLQKWYEFTKTKSARANYASEKVADAVTKAYNAVKTRSRGLHGPRLLARARPGP